MEQHDPKYIIDAVTQYFSSELIIPNENNVDISYSKWISKDDNLKKLCKPIKIKNIDEELNTIIARHDHDCELKLIKWITEDKEHKDKFVKIPKSKVKINRDSNILPYYYNIATTNGQPFKDESNYINASFINGPFINDGDNNMFIATQAPLPDTLFAFWSMIKTYQVPLIAMLSNISEAGRIKSEVYWPLEVNTEKIITSPNGEEKISIVLKNINDVTSDNFIVRKFIVDGELEVEQIQILNWSDHSIPNKIETFDTIQLLIDSIFKYNSKTEKRPTVLHCSAGVGRTGCFIGIFNIVKCLSQIQQLKGKTEEEIFPFFNVFNVVRKLREQRYSMVSDPDQYKFMYSYILEWIKKNMK